MSTNTPTYLVLHHSAVSRVANGAQFDAVKKYHCDKGWGDIAYHYFIEPDGQLKTGRAETAVGAHCKEADLNFKSLGICLAGDFDAEEPTVGQLLTLRGFVAELRKKYNIATANVVGHRQFATYKSCPGARFTAALIAEIAGVAPPPVPTFAPPAWARDGIAWCTQQNIMTKITGESVPDYRLATMFHNFAKFLGKAS